jgi:hypothetical protein
MVEGVKWPNEKRTKVSAVEIRAEVRQVKSMVDHSYNVTLYIPEDCIEQVKVLMGWIGNEVRAVIENVTK